MEEIFVYNSFDEWCECGMAAALHKEFDKKN